MYVNVRGFICSMVSVVNVCMRDVRLKNKIGVIKQYFVTFVYSYHGYSDNSSLSKVHQNVHALLNRLSSVVVAILLSTTIVRTALGNSHFFREFSDIMTSSVVHA